MAGRGLAAGPAVPWGLRPAVCAAAVAVLLTLTAWFGAELVAGAGQAGLAERIVGVAQALRLLAVVQSCRFQCRAASGSTAYAHRTSVRLRGRAWASRGGRGASGDGAVHGLAERHRS